jgi:hypothetical protein
MGDPVTMGMIGAGVGAITNRRNPLQGALLGGALGGFGGAAMGGIKGASAAANAAQASNIAAQRALSYGATQTAAGQTLNQGLGASLLSGAKDAFGGINTFAKQNPLTTQVGLGALQSAVTPAPPPEMAPPPGLMRGQQFQMEDPTQVAMGSPRISLI